MVFECLHRGSLLCHGFLPQAFSLRTCLGETRQTDTETAFPAGAKTALGFYGNPGREDSLTDRRKMSPRTEMQKEAFLSRGQYIFLQIVVHLKFRRIGNLLHLLQFGPFSGHPYIDEPLGEDAALGQVIVVCLQGIQSLAQGRGQSLDLLLLLGGEGVEVEVIRSPSDLA